MPTEPIDPRSARRNLILLVVASGLYVLMASIDLTLTGLVGYGIAPTHALATLPYALIYIAGTISPPFAATLMERLGRRAAFTIGAYFAAIGGLVSVWAVSAHDFALFCVGTALVGAYQGFAVYYKYAAADSVSAERRPRVVSYVVGAGVVAALGGPFIAVGSRHLLGTTYAGAYAVVSLIALATVVVLVPLRMTRPLAMEPAVDETVEVARRPLRLVVTQAVFLVGLSGMAIGYFVMMLLMTVAPIAGAMHHHSTGQNALVIQWHLIGMFAPSLASGILVVKLGASRVLAVGTGLAVLAATVNLVGTSQLDFLLALGGIGVAWNLMQVAGTTMVIESYRPAERARTQAAAESSTAVAATLGALGSGVLLDTIGWRSLNVVALCALALPAALTIWQLARAGGRLGLARGATSSTR
jgi:MFS family permease